MLCTALSMVGCDSVKNMTQNYSIVKLHHFRVNRSNSFWILCIKKLILYCTSSQQSNPLYLVTDQLIHCRQRLYTFSSPFGLTMILGCIKFSGYKTIKDGTETGHWVLLIYLQYYYISNQKVFSYVIIWKSHFLQFNHFEPMICVFRNSSDIWWEWFSEEASLSHGGRPEKCTSSNTSGKSRAPNDTSSKYTTSVYIYLARPGIYMTTTA